MAELFAFPNVFGARLGLIVAHSKCEFVAFLANIRLGWEDMPVTNVQWAVL